ncbi:hypothetical protein [Parasutterella excrementihominis]|uniref:hypothetical protein n=1 Tax=Parasutterella excrementihominis TaxID=487175 RepID=UPI0035616C01
MQAISLWLAAAIVILTGWAIVKKYQVNMVLFIAGLLLNIIGVMNGATNFLPKNATATGLLLTSSNSSARSAAPRLPASVSLFLFPAVLLST